MELIIRHAKVDGIDHTNVYILLPRDHPVFTVSDTEILKMGVDPTCIDQKVKEFTSRLASFHALPFYVTNSQGMILLTSYIKRVGWTKNTYETVGTDMFKSLKEAYKEKQSNPEKPVLSESFDTSINLEEDW